MSRKEKYLSKENFGTEMKDLIMEIRESGGTDREYQFKGTPALLVTDMQEYFLSPDSHAFIPSTEAIIPNILRLIKYFEDHNYLIIYTQHLNTEGNSRNMKTWWKDTIRESSPFSFLSSTLPVSCSTHILKKSQYDAFYQTELENILRKNNIETLVICGVMANLCCETTLRSAFVRGFNAILPVDATAAYKREYHKSTFVNLSFGFCPVKTVKEMLQIMEE